VAGIHLQAGTILGSSRGPVDIARAVDNLIRRGVNILFTVGGDGTQRGAKALFEEAQKRGYPLSVVGIPKTIDGDIPFVAHSFGFLTAVEEAVRVLQRAHTEACGAPNGIALVKLMGRHAGFLTAEATVASQDVNFTLIPEVPFQLEGECGFLAALERRILSRGHAVLAVAEGAGQELLRNTGNERDASGNVRLKDIGTFLNEKIGSWFNARKIPFVMRYFDPSYIVRSSPANAEDSVLCDQYARHAAHAAMAGKTGLVIGLMHDCFIHVPIDLLATQEKRLDPDGSSWSAEAGDHAGGPACSRRDERYRARSNLQRGFHNGRNGVGGRVRRAQVQACAKLRQADRRTMGLRVGGNLRQHGNGLFGILTNGRLAGEHYRIRPV
jgi:6-phosphofructokinase 1